MDKNKEFGLSPEIAKLAEKLAKDPSSKLFVPLAEEYRKTGMLEEALQILMDGLKANPNYMTARVSLGKMLLEKGNISEAQDEFEKVVQAIPDNLFAHKKLAEIYQSEGNTENLLKEYKIILSLSPKDEDVISALGELEGRVPLGSVEKIEEKLESHRYGIEPEKRSETIQKEEEDVMAVVEEEARKEKEDVVYDLPEETFIPEELGIDVLPMMIPVEEGLRIKEMDKFTVSIKEPAGEEIATETMAEIYIKQGLYEKADEVFQKILSSEPENMVIRQKREELICLVNLLTQKGSGNTIRISKLEAWLKNINERRK